MTENRRERSTVLRIGQFTGWHGDRSNGMAELLRSDVDVLTGDYLAELTMLVLSKNSSRGGVGYVNAFLDELSPNLTQIAAKGVKVITNAGGLDPLACAAEIRKACIEAGVELSVAAITGDDVRQAVAAGQGEFRNMDTGEALTVPDSSILTANAYLGAWPIVAALNSGADIVVCPRATDASLIVGAAASRFDWASDDYDRLAGAVIAGHIIECGAQATGGNFSFFSEITDRRLPGMPIAEISADGSAIISKARDTGGMVSVDTVKAQLLYEIGSAAYQNPDVVTDLSSVHVSQAETDCVLVEGVRGFPPTGTTKVSLTYEGGYRNTMTIGLTGRDIDRKIAWLTDQLATAIGTPDSFDGYRVSQLGPKNPHGSLEESSAWLVITVRDRSRDRVNRANFADQIVQIATSSIPGFYLTAPPQKERLFGVQWPTLIAKHHIATDVNFGDGATTRVEWPTGGESVDAYSVSELSRTLPAWVAEPNEPVLLAELGSLLGVRSGDKGGLANVGIWARSPEAYSWLVNFLTVERFKSLIPEAAELVVQRHTLSNLWGLNFMVVGFLEDGVSSSTRIDPQAKGLGEYLGSRIVELPSRLSELGGDTVTRRERIDVSG